MHASLSRAVEHMATLNPRTDMRIWLLGIMHRVLASRSWRARMRRANPPDAELSDLHRLTQEQRSVLLLVTIEDLSYAEVAQVLGVPLGQVMSLLAEGRERLRVLAEEPAMRWPR